MQTAAAQQHQAQRSQAQPRRPLLPQPDPQPQAQSQPQPRPQAQPQPPSRPPAQPHAQVQTQVITTSQAEQQQQQPQPQEAAPAGSAAAAAATSALEEPGAWQWPQLGPILWTQPSLSPPAVQPLPPPSLPPHQHAYHPAQPPLVLPPETSPADEPASFEEPAPPEGPASPFGQRASYEPLSPHATSTVAPLLSPPAAEAPNVSSLSPRGPSPSAAVEQSQLGAADEVHSRDDPSLQSPAMPVSSSALMQGSPKAATSVEVAAGAEHATGSALSALWRASQSRDGSPQGNSAPLTGGRPLTQGGEAAAHTSASPLTTTLPPLPPPSQALRRSASPAAAPWGAPTHPAPASAGRAADSGAPAASVCGQARPAVLAASAPAPASVPLTGNVHWQSVRGESPAAATALSRASKGLPAGCVSAEEEIRARVLDALGRQQAPAVAAAPRSAAAGCVNSVAANAVHEKPQVGIVR